MSDIILTAYYNHSHGGMADWIMHTAMSAVIHAVIYSFIFRAMAHLSLASGLVLVLLVVGGLYLWGQRRDRRSW